MKPGVLIFSALILTGAAACGLSAKDDRRPSQSADSCEVAAQLPLPVLPDSLTEPRQRLSYVLTHFWDAMDWTDSVLIGSEEFMEQNAANFYDLFRLTDSVSASDATARMLAGASVSPRAYAAVADIAEKYLYDPNSPMLNEESYLIVSELLVADAKLPETEIARIADRRRRLLKNRVGTKAADFVFVDRDGRRSTLSDVIGRRPYTVVMFYDTDCENCKEVERQLAETPELGAAIEAGQLTFLAVCPFETDRGKWTAQAQTFPAEWLVGYSPEGRVADDEVYDIRATPSIYAIARDGLVIGKDVKADTLRALIATLP